MVAEFWRVVRMSRRLHLTSHIGRAGVPASEYPTVMAAAMTAVLRVRPGERRARLGGDVECGAERRTPHHARGSDRQRNGAAICAAQVCGNAGMSAMPMAAGGWRSPGRKKVPKTRSQTMRLEP